MKRVLFTAALCLCVLPLDAQEPTFSSRREIVRVDVLVTNDGQPVRDLRPADFEVLDSGVPQQVDFFSFEQLPLSVVLALDSSASISAARLANLREGGDALLGALKSDDQAALLTFADAVMLRERLTANVKGVQSALARMDTAANPFGGTALIDACYTAMTMVDGEAGRGLLIAFTDGVDTSSWLPPDKVLQAARRSNLVVYAVSTSALPKGSFLRDLSDATGGEAIQIESTERVRAAFVRIIDEFRQRYLIGFSPENVPGGGWHPLTVRVKNRKLDVKARAGYAR